MEISRGVWSISVYRLVGDISPSWAPRAKAAGQSTSSPLLQRNGSPKYASKAKAESPTSHGGVMERGCVSWAREEKR